jgi:dephospho-CoA kinase
MLKVGVTGGIGSGKSIVCQVFATLGIPIFNADTAAKYLMQHDETLKQNLISLLGADIYNNGILITERVSQLVFNNKALLNQLNALVHPATIAYARQWLSKQNTPYSIKEAALFFESGTAAEMDIMIGVSAPLTLRINRVIQRSALTEKQVMDRVSGQMDEEQKMALCNHVIINNDFLPVIPQVLHIHQQLLSLSASKQL